MSTARSLPLHSAVLGVLLVTTGVAFGLTFSTGLQWHQRDAVSATVTDARLVESTEGGHRVVLNVTVDNPLERPVGVASIRLLVYEGDPPPTRGEYLSVPRSGTVERTIVPAGGRVTVRAWADVRPEDVDRLRRALANDTANSRGVMSLRLSGEEFQVNVA